MPSDQAGSSMQVDVLSTGAKTLHEQSPTNIMMEEADLHWQFRQERENYLKLEPHKFSLTNM